MKILYIECGMGAAGDMLLAALTELMPDREAFIRRLNSMGIPHVKFVSEKTSKYGVCGTHIRVLVGDGEEEPADIGHHTDFHHDHAHQHACEDGHHDESVCEHKHEHHHSGLHDIKHIISHLDVAEQVKNDAMQVYSLIAQAEAKAHDTTVDLVHFHEVGALDAVADITGVCLAISELSPDKIICSPVRIGFGQVRCAHGILPVPAPATAELITGIPVYSGDIEGEMCTPTGAALLKHFASEFSVMPVMNTLKIGYGAGKKDFPAANILRVFMGESENSGINDGIVTLNCNLDDMTGEDISFACLKLFDCGALDVFTVPIQMKKNRPGTLLCCICKEKDADMLASQILRHTTTIGVRKQYCSRYILNREEINVDTVYGSVRVKKSSGFGVEKHKPEADDIHVAAEKSGHTVAEIRAEVEKALQKLEG